LSEPAWWDRYTGATDSAARMRERVAEDRLALARAGRTAINLGFLDDQYRGQTQPLEPLVEQIERLLVPAAHIYAPAALAGHADHALVREAALRLRASGLAVSLYADLPHANANGWPVWVIGKRGPASKDLAAAAWDDVLAGADVLTPVVHELDSSAYAQKLAAVRLYRSQLQALQEFASWPFVDHKALGFEVEWATASPASESSPAASRR
jgi:LmbE family N-acetylglucosaminyl deacetylase